MEAGYLLLAYKLSILTFNLGVLVYALPAPWPPLKAWAPRLIADAVLAAALSLLFYTLLGASDWVARLLGGSWPLFYAWYESALTSLMGTKAFIFLLSSVSGTSPLGEAVSVILRPLDRVVDAGLFMVSWVGAITYIVYEYGGALAAIGVALIAVPFRVSRGAGAWLLAFVLVFNGGLQVLPSFLASIAEEPGGVDPAPLEEYGLAYAEVGVSGYQGTPVGGGLLWLRVEGGPAANYTVVGGRAYDEYFSSTVPVPSRVPSYYTLEVDGLLFNLKPYPVHPTDYAGSGPIWAVNLSNNYLVWLRDYVIAYTDDGFTGYEASDSTYTVRVRLGEGRYMGVRVPDACRVSVKGGEGLDASRGGWEWLGVEGVEYRYTARVPGEYSVTVSVEECGEVRPRYDNVVSYFSAVSGFGAFGDPNILASLILYYVTIPLLYIAVLFSIAYGVARLIGGRERLPVKF